MRRAFAPVLSALVGLGGLGGLMAAGQATAAAVTYSDEAAFVAATGAGLHALPTSPGGGILVASTITSVDGVLTFRTASGDLVGNWEASTGVSRFAGPDLAISGVESFNVDVQFGEDRYAFGFGIYESTSSALAGCNFTCVESTFTISLYNNGVLLSPSYTLSPANDVAQFWGLHTDFAFDAIRIRETIGGADNEIFGTFYSGTQAVAGTVAAPGSLALAGLALLGLGLRRRR